MPWAGVQDVDLHGGALALGRNGVDAGGEPLVDLGVVDALEVERWSGRCDGRGHSAELRDLGALAVDLGASGRGGRLEVGDLGSEGGDGGRDVVLGAGAR
jgi:hypothetical protein